MKDYEKEKYLYRILSGKTMLKRLRLDVLAPSLDLLYEAEEIYSEYFDKKGLMSKEDLHQYLLNDGEITIQDLNYIKEFRNLLENLQVELCSNFSDQLKADQWRKMISDAKEKYEYISTKVSEYDSYSKEGLANYAKSIFLIRNTTYCNQKLYDFSNIQPVVILNELNKYIISVDDVRNLAKNSSWANTWFSLKGQNIFNNFPTFEQQLLIMWSKIYDNVRESMEFPGEDLLQDNDALDGWLIIQNKKSKEKQNEKKTKLSRNSKIANADEVFIIANNKEEADRINRLNSNHARRIKDERLKQIQAKGAIHHHNFLDVRRDIQAEYHKLQMDRLKGK